MRNFYIGRRKIRISILQTIKPIKLKHKIILVQKLVRKVVPKTPINQIEEVGNLKKFMEPQLFVIIKKLKFKNFSHL